MVISMENHDLHDHTGQQSAVLVIAVKKAIIDRDAL